MNPKTSETSRSQRQIMDTVVRAAKFDVLCLQASGFESFEVNVL